MTPQSIKEPSPRSGQVTGNRWTGEHGTWDKAERTWISAWVVGVVGTKHVRNVFSSVLLLRNCRSWPLLLCEHQLKNIQLQNELNTFQTAKRAQFWKGKHVDVKNVEM